MSMLLDIIAQHKAGKACGIFSVCSAHPLVIEATFVHALHVNASIVLIEATSNQVNQDGGYTGMVPKQFRDFVFAIADQTGFARDRVLLGGDHLGPNAWNALPADDAMAKAEIMIDQYVRAGFRKIHLDCSMSCAGDPVPLPEAVVAERAARLCAVSEAAYASVGGQAPVYVIGTEVPVPGGSAEDLETLQVTTPQAAMATIEMHRAIFPPDAWPRVIAAVVQPGVEFDHHKVVDYDPLAASALSKSIETRDQFVFEAHSTDYQTPQALTALVRDHFAILKVGPGVTFALREALWALDAIERDWLGTQASGFRETVMKQLRAQPMHWIKYYHSAGHALEIDLQYSLSDRIRYYWPDPLIAAAQDTMFTNLRASPPPSPLISQYLPLAYAALRAGVITNDPKALVMAHIASVLDTYHEACVPNA
jgi:D-tagatose-1,6-bisphosphate aldolase subunit GatZ/KbaZ